MIRCLFLLFYYTIVNANHFNGGTIRWYPVDPYDNSSSVTITIIQSYSWTYPNIKCANNVPISTSGRSTQASNLTCVVDCTTDGGYSTKPVTTLTDCASVSSSLGIMTSQRSTNITLAKGAHFYLAYVGSAWSALGVPAVSGLEWSIVTSIDLRMRPDGLINTPPVASIVSPQFIILNRTTDIQIPVSDENVNDDIRCRWSVYISGSRRRRQINEDLYHESVMVSYKEPSAGKKVVLNREKRVVCSAICTLSACRRSCPCTCPRCLGTTCTGSICTIARCLPGTTTIDTPGTLKSTSSYPVRQAIDECGDICYPSSMPNGTNLSGCTLTLKGLVPDTWYAASIQVEDFIDVNSSIPMSSVPIQFLIYVMDEPDCSLAPVIIPITHCLEVTVGVSMSFNLTALNLCDPTVADLADIVLSKEIIGMTESNLTDSLTNTSLAYVTFTWTPQANQMGTQKMCAIAYTEEQVQSTEYCVSFNVTASLDPCATTTTVSTSTTTTSLSTTTTSSSTTTISSTTTTTVSTIITSTLITTASSTIMTPSSTTLTTNFTTATPSTTVAAAAAILATTTKKDSGKGPSWGLIAGILSVALPLALCSFLCVYRLLYSPTKDDPPEEEVDDEWQNGNSSSRPESTLQTTPDINENLRIRKPSKNYQVYNILSKNNSATTVGSTIDNESSILVTMYNNTNARRANSVRTPNTEQSFEMGNAWIRAQTPTEIADSSLTNQRVLLESCRTNRISGIEETDASLNVSRQISDQRRLNASSPLSPQTGHYNSFESPPNKMHTVRQAYSFGGSVLDSGVLAKNYLLGNGHQTKVSNI